MSPNTPDYSEKDNKDISLMLLVKKGDQESFRFIVEKYQRLLVNTASKMLGDSKDAEDIAQQALVKLWNSSSRYKPTAKLSTYLLTILKRLVFNESKKRKIRRDHIESSKNLAPSNFNSPLSESIHNELLKAIDNALLKLPEKQRLITILRQQENLPYKEISKIVGISLPSVKTNLFRARESLKVSLKDYLGKNL